MKVQLRAFSEEKFVGVISINEGLSHEQRVELVEESFNEAPDYWALDNKVIEYPDGKTEFPNKKKAEELARLPIGEKSYIFTKQEKKDTEPIEYQVFESELTLEHINLMLGDVIAKTWNPLPYKVQEKFIQLLNTKAAINLALGESNTVERVLWDKDEELPLAVGFTLVEHETKWEIIGTSFSIPQDQIKELGLEFEFTSSTMAVLKITYSDFVDLVKKVKAWESTKKSK